MTQEHEQLALASATMRYIGLEALDVVEELVAVCGPTIDGRALVVLRRRLSEEAPQVALLEARGYTRMAEKSAQLVASLQALITMLEGRVHDG